MTHKISRRALLRNLCGGAGARILARRLDGVRPAQNREQEREQDTSGDVMVRIGRTFMQEYSVPGLSIAISRHGKFVYEHQFGMADREDARLVLPDSLFRIASVTKPITSVTIFSLIEKGKLNLNDKVFGPSGILDGKFGTPPYKRYVTDITVDHLLTHTCGGWPNDSSDPMFRFNIWDQAKLISWALDTEPLTSPPGLRWAYSNFGYCLLGRVIEQVTGEPYADYVQANILAVCGIRDMRIAGNKLQERASNEVEYYGQYHEDPYRMNVSRMDSHGGWIATPADLVIFLDHLIGAPKIPSLLKPETIKIMTTPSPAYPQSLPGKYARGWMVRNNGAGNWWHNGSLPGSTTIMVRTATGLSWAALTNTRSQPSDDIGAALDQMMWDMVRQVPAWNA